MLNGQIALVATTREPAVGTIFIHHHPARESIKVSSHAILNHVIQRNLVIGRVFPDQPDRLTIIFVSQHGRQKKCFCGGMISTQSGDDFPADEHSNALLCSDVGHRFAHGGNCLKADLARVPAAKTPPVPLRVRGMLPIPFVHRRIRKVTAHEDKPTHLPLQQFRTGEPGVMIGPGPEQGFKIIQLAGRIDGHTVVGDSSEQAPIHLN